MFRVTRTIFLLSSMGLLVFPVLAYSQMLDPSHSHAITVVPSDTDPAIRNFNDPSVILAKNTGGPVPLVIFMPGTEGIPHSTLFFEFIAGLGYPVINLEYDDFPAVNVVCPSDPDPDCTARFRQDRIYGGHVSSHVDTPSSETIMNRIVKLLEYLDRYYPTQHWGTYLAHGQPDWSRIIVSGLSQGAGMAAYMAKHQNVARVVLFSSPWDFTNDRQPAPWLYGPSATPMERWYAEYHQREKTAAQIHKSYLVLGISPDHIFVFNAGFPRGRQPEGKNPYHTSTIRNMDYVPQWKIMFGRPKPGNNL